MPACMSFMTREELFHHKLTHMEDPSPFHPSHPFFNFEDDRIKQLLQANRDLIFAPHRFSRVGADFSFPMTILLSNNQWVREIYQHLDLVADINTEEAYKFSFSLGLILVHRETGEYRYFTPHNNNAFFKKPVHIDRPSCWQNVYEQLTQEALMGHVMQHREDTNGFHS